MFKKALVVVLGLVLLVGLLFGRSAWSYVTATVSEIRDSVKGSVPVEFELKRAKKEISRVNEDIRDAIHEIAKEEVQVEKLAREIATKEAHLAKAKSDMLTLTAHLEANAESGEKTHFVSKGRSYSESKVRADLRRRVTRYRTEKATHEKLVQIYDARERGLNAAREKLEKMRAEQKQLEVEVANLEAEHKMVEVAKASSEFDFDDSKLSRARSTLEEIRTRLEVEKKLANADVHFPDQIPVGEEDEVSADIVDEVNALLSPEDDSYVGSAR